MMITYDDAGIVDDMDRMADTLEEIHQDLRAIFAIMLITFVVAAGIGVGCAVWLTYRLM